MIAITRHGPEVIDELRPLWLAMAHHHAEVAPQMGPPLADDETWARRRAHYEDTLRKEDAFALLARDDDGRAVGYATVIVMPYRSETWIGPGDRFAELDSLSVLPGARGQGVGEALVARVQEEIDALGLPELQVWAMADNTRAVAFYERLGFRRFLVGLRREQGPGA